MNLVEAGGNCNITSGQSAEGFFVPHLDCSWKLATQGRVGEKKQAGNTMEVDCIANYVKLLLFCKVHFVIRRPN